MNLELNDQMNSMGKRVENEKSFELHSIIISPEETHHLLRGEPLYENRFIKVMSFHSPGIAAVKDESGAYHINLDGRPVYNKNFIQTFGFYENTAAVEDKTGWYHIDFEGKPLYDERYSWIGNFQEGRCVVRDKQANYFHIKRDGNRAYQQNYKYAGDFKYGMAVVYLDSGFARHIDRNSRFTHDKKYNELDVFHKGFAVARDSDGYFHIDKQGKPLYDTRYDWVEPFYNGFALAGKSTGELIIIDESGHSVIEVRDDNSQYVKELSRKNIMGMLVGYWKTQIMHSIVELGILERIKEGNNNFSRLKSSLDLPEQSLKMIIDILKVWNMIEDTDGRYCLTYVGELLTEGHPESLKYAALMWGEEHYFVMQRLTDALRAYEPQFKKVFGSDFFNYCSKNKEKGRIYNEAMREYSHDYSSLIELFSFPKTNIIMDVGGSTGHLLAKILEKNRQIEKGILFEIPFVIEEAKIILKDSIIKEKLEFVSGNFFEDIPVRADTIILSRILHDWDDKTSNRILKNVHKSLTDDGQLLIFETVVPDDSKKDLGKTLNFNLLVVVGGKERTREEFESILRNSGFIISEIMKGHSIISLIVCEKMAEGE